MSQMTLLKFHRFGTAKTKLEMRILAHLSSCNLDGDFLGGPMDLTTAYRFCQNVVNDAPGDNDVHKYHNDIKVELDETSVCVIVVGRATDVKRKLCGFSLINNQNKKSMTDFKTIALTEIRPDPNQPRRLYDETAMQELTSSVKEKGILQPILIRPDSKGYVLVCGERRYRAASSAGLTEVPAVIRELTDDEALELQIIENLQRKDVHPIEEAVAFKSLVEKGKDVHEIAAKVGKSDFYVRQRIKLAGLSKQWQEIYFQNLVSHKDALELARFAEDDQMRVYKSSVRKSGKEIHVNSVDWEMRKLSGELHGAPFDTKDPTLNPKMGPCTTCPFNTAVSSLFPEDAKNPVCKKIECYNLKTSVQFDRTLEEVKQDPSFTLISCCYRSTDDKFTNDLQKDHKILFSEAYNKVGYDGYSTLAGLENAKASAATKAFSIDGSSKGKYFYIRLTGSRGSKTTASKTKDKIASGKVTAADIDAEIQRINDREKRSKEIDSEKLWLALRPLLSVDDHKELFAAVPFTSNKLSQEERNAMAVALLEQIDYNDRELAVKAVNIKGSRYGIDVDQIKKIAVTDAQLFHALRLFMISICKKTGMSPATSTGPAAIMPVLRSKGYMPEKINELEKEFQEKISKRQTNVSKRLGELTVQKKLLGAKPAKKATKKRSSSLKKGIKQLLKK